MRGELFFIYGKVQKVVKGKKGVVIIVKNRLGRLVLPVSDEVSTPALYSSQGIYCRLTLSPTRVRKAWIRFEVVDIEKISGINYKYIQGFMRQNKKLNSLSAAFREITL